MNIDSKACFLAAKQAGMDFLSVSESYSKETSLSVHNGEVESQQIGSSSQYSFKGIYDGKKGIYSLDYYEPDRLDDIISSVKERSSYGTTLMARQNTKKQRLSARTLFPRIWKRGEKRLLLFQTKSVQRIPG